MSDGSDSFADAPDAILNTVTDPFSNAGYTTETGEWSPVDDPTSEWFGSTGAFTRSAWWKFTALVSDAFQVHAQRSRYDPLYYAGDIVPDVLVAVYQGTAVDDLTLIARGSINDGSGWAGDTGTWTPWVANFAATAGSVYYVQFSSIYDEPINYQLTTVPAPSTLLGDWTDGTPVEFDITDAAHSDIGVDTGALHEADFATAAFDFWDGSTPTTSGVPIARLFLAGIDGDVEGAWTVAWHRYDATWPTSVTYDQVVPDGEGALPAHVSTEWADPAAPGTSRRMLVSIGDFSSSSDPDATFDTLGTLKLATYTPPGDPGTEYNPGFMIAGAINRLSTIGVGYPSDPDPIDVPLSPSVQAVAFALIDNYTATRTVPGLSDGDSWEVSLQLAFAQILATAVPHYRYTYADIPITNGTATNPLKYPMRRIPPVNNGGFGPTRYPRTVNRRAGGTY